MSFIDSEDEAGLEALASIMESENGKSSEKTDSESKGKMNENSLKDVKPGSDYPKLSSPRQSPQNPRLQGKVNWDILWDISWEVLKCVIINLLCKIYVLH